MSIDRTGEIIMNTPDRIVVRGHLTAEEMRRRTGWSGYVQQTWWRHAYMPLKQRQLIAVPRGKYVNARRAGKGAFAVTILDIRRTSK